MNTQALLKKVEQFGIRLEVRGDKLRAEVPENLLTLELVAEFKAHKAEILATLIAQDHGLPLADLKQAAGPDWPEIENDPATLKALANSITTRRMRERGEVPPDYIAATVCRHCGPVPIYQGIAERVLGCPWCFNRAKGLPVPKAPTKTEIQDMGPAMMIREGCTGNSPWDYSPSDKVRVGKDKPEASDE